MSTNDTITPTMWVIQVQGQDNQPVITEHNPFGLWYVGGETYMSDDAEAMVNRAITLQADHPQYRYVVLDYATLVASTVADEPTQPTYGSLEPHIVAGDEGLTLAISQHEADLAEVDRVFAAEAERRQWCSEYEGILRTINTGLYRPLLRGRNGDATPRAQRAERHTQAVQRPGSIQAPQDAQAWGIWHTVPGAYSTADWLTEDGNPRATYATREAAEARADQMHQTHGSQGHTYTVIPVPVGDRSESLDLINAENARLTTVNENLRNSLTTQGNARDNLLRQVGQALLDLNDDQVDEILTNWNDRCLGNWEFPTRERDYEVRGTASITVYLNVDVSTTVSARDEDHAMDEAEFSHDDIYQAIRDEHGRDVADLWDGEWDMDNTTAEEA